jgi:aldose 1-epimerase
MPTMSDIHGPHAGAPFGTTADGVAARLFTLGHADGPLVRISDFGATLVEVHLPDRDRRRADVALGFDRVERYQSSDNMYFGATVGRVANRIAGARFSIDGHDYRLAANQAPNHLHGGPDRALSKVSWDVLHADAEVVELAYESPDGEEGYPGNLRVTARYTLLPRGLMIAYRASSDRATPVNLTNHAYWNLAGAGNGTILDHELRVAASTFTPVDDTLIPTGEVLAVDGTPFDLRQSTRVGERIDELEPTRAGGYDHNLVIDGRPGELRFAARLHDPSSGRILELHTDQPALQVYAGNNLRGQSGKDDRIYAPRGAMCLEPQVHPDALHHPDFPSVLLAPDELYEHVSVFGFGHD